MIVIKAKTSNFSNPTWRYIRAKLFTRRKRFFNIAINILVKKFAYVVRPFHHFMLYAVHSFNIAFTVNIDACLLTPAIFIG